MTLCRKCGREIPDGEELCEDCKSSQGEFDEAYLDELMHSMEAEIAESQGPVTEDTLEDISLDDLSLEDIQMDEMGEDLLQETPDDLSSESAGEEKQEPEEEMSEEPEEFSLEDVQAETEEEPEEEFSIEDIQEEEPEEEFSIEDIQTEEEPEEEFSMEDVQAEEAEESSEEEDIDELLSMLSQDYEDFDEADDGEAAEGQPSEANTEVMDESPAEASLFVEDDGEDGLFAEDIDALSVNDIFDDALSAVDYSEAEEDHDDDMEEFISPGEEETSEGFEDLSLDSLGLDDVEAPEAEVGTAAIADPLAGAKKEKNSFWKRIFGNIITEQSAEEEAKEREQERATAEEKALAREEKKKQLEAEKAEKAEKTQADKERKAAEKAEKAAVKEANKEEKKRLKLEMEANEVVGKINPVGASIVMVFFGLLCVAVILGTQSLSYTSSVRNAESSLEDREYRDAYEFLAGVDVSEASQETKDKIRICMQLQRGLDGFSNYYEMKMYLESLDSLMKGIRSYDENKGKAEDYDILGQYNELEARLAKQLYDEFGVSESQARSINATETQEEYTSRLENIITQWELRNKEDER